MSDSSSLTYIYFRNNTFASAIAKDFAVAVNPVVQQLNRFERVGENSNF